METKVHKLNQNAIPTWLTNGVEAFASNDGIFLVIDGQTTPFDKAPSRYQRIYAKAFMADKAAQRYIKKAFGLTGFIKSFEKWMFCKFGGLDNVSDIDDDGDLIPDIFNNVCAEDCPHRGRFCGTGSLLSARDVETLCEMGNGSTIEQAADKLFISVPGMKSRVNTLKEKTNSANMAELILKTAHMGAI